MSKKTLCAIFTLLLTLAFKVGFFVHAQTDIPDYPKEDAFLVEHYADMLDYENIDRCILYKDEDKLDCQTTEPAVHYIYNSKIATDEKVINKNTVLLDANTYKFYPGDTFYEDTQIGWTLIEHAYVNKSNFDVIQAEKTTKRNNPFHIYSANAQTFYAGAGDGYVDDYEKSTWDLAHNDTAGVAGRNFPTTGADGLRANASKSASPTYYVSRAFLPFDITTIPNDACIASATLYVFNDTNNVVTEAGTYNYVQPVCPTTQADNSTLGISDIDTCGDVHSPTLCSDTKVWFTNAAQYNSYVAFALNEDGLDAIDPTAYYALFGLRQGHDLTDTAPTSNGNNIFYADASEETGTGADPYLLIATTTCEEEPATSTTAASPGLVPVWNDLSVISGYAEEYTDSTTTPSKVIYYVYHIPFFVWCVFAFLFSFFFGRLLLELIIYLRQK